VAAANGVRARQRHDLAVVEAHAVENVPQVLRSGHVAAHVRVREAAVRWGRGACFEGVEGLGSGVMRKMI